jgi:hypothetical protein
MTEEEAVAYLREQEGRARFNEAIRTVCDALEAVPAPGYTCCGGYVRSKSKV